MMNVVLMLKVSLSLSHQYIPTIAEAVLERLTRESKTPEVRTMCIQVVSVLSCFAHS